MWRPCPQDPLEKPLTVKGPGVRIPLSPQKGLSIINT